MLIDKDDNKLLYGKKGERESGCQGHDLGLKYNYKCSISRSLSYHQLNPTTTTTPYPCKHACIINYFILIMTMHMFLLDCFFSFLKNVISTPTMPSCSSHVPALWI